MEEKIEFVDITPHKSILPKMGRAGYSTAQAIAELIDNAIDERLENEKLFVDVDISEESIKIKDNACGMNKEKLAKAFSLAHSDKTDKLGEFGLGLKTSCQSLGEKFSILTTTKEDKNYFLLEYDEEEWLNNEEQSWKKYPLKILNKKNFSEHGTVIEINKLKIKIKYALDQIKKDIGNRFAPFIKRKEVEIKVNDKLTKPFEPELIKGTKKDFKINLEGNEIYGWYGLLKESSQKGFYGFNIFRRGRMITCYDKIGIPEHATVARIIGEIHLDHLSVTHNKREFIKDSTEYLEVEEALSNKFKDIVKEARRKSKDDKVTTNVKQEVDLWKNKIVEALKSNALKGLVEFNTKEKKISKIGKNKGDTDIEKREKLNLDTTPPNLKDEQKVKPNERKPKKTHKKKHTIDIRGKRFEFNIEYFHLGINAPWKTYSISELSGVLEIIINVDFPAWLTTKDTPFYVVILIGEAISEILCKQSGDYNPQRIQEIKEEILRKTSELKNEFEEEVEQKKDEYREATSFLTKR